MAPIAKFSGVSKTGFSRLDNVLAANIGGVDNVDLVLTTPPQSGDIVKLFNYYNFRGETTAESHATNSTWRPSSRMFNQKAENLFTDLDTDAYVIWRNHNTPTDIYYDPDDGTINPGGGLVKLITTTGDFSSIPDALQIRFNWIDTVDENIKGWGLASGPTTSGQTGPNGGSTSPYLNDDNSVFETEITDLTSFNNIPFTNPNPNLGGVDGNVNNKYIYTEATNYDTDDIFVCCFNISNVVQRMSNSNNDLKLKFMTHAYGADMGKLFIGVQSGQDYAINDGVDPFAETFPRLYGDSDSNTPSNTQALVELAFFSSDDLKQQQGNNQSYTEREVSLNNLKNYEGSIIPRKSHWIYFVYGNHTQYRADLSIDNIRIEEIVP